MLGSTYLSISNLLANGLNASIKRHRFAEWIKKGHRYVAYKRLTSNLKSHIDWKWGIGKALYANENKKTGVTIFISDKTDFKPKSVTRDKEHYIMVKGFRGCNTWKYVPDIEAPKLIQQRLDIKEFCQENTLVITTPSSNNRSNHQ